MSTIEESPAEVGRRIALLRETFGLSQTKFASEIGVKQGEVAAWESGERRPGLTKAKHLVRRWGVTLDWLMYGDARYIPHDLALRLADTARARPEPDQG